MNEPTPEQIAKLPKWAQEHIKSLSREANMWKEATIRFSKEQYESPFYTESFDGPRQFISAQLNTVCVDNAGVHAEIMATRKDDGQRNYGVEIRYRTMGSDFDCGVALIPKSTGLIELVAKENMR